jgi:hypothetical protein
MDKRLAFHSHFSHFKGYLSISGIISMLLKNGVKNIDIGRTSFTKSDLLLANLFQRNLTPNFASVDEKSIDIYKFNKMNKV